VSDESDFVLIGLLRRAHGTGGEISVEPVSDIPERFQKLEYVLVRKGSMVAESGVESVRTKGRAILLKLRGTDDRTAAEALTGAEIGVRMKDVFPVPEDTYYVFDLVGSKVIGESGREIGVLENVLQMPANDVLVVRAQGREVLIPAVKSVVKKVDRAAKRIVIEEIRGLLD
jgi:16S rRNA processing protein RimM